VLFNAIGLFHPIINIIVKLLEVTAYQENLEHPTHYYFLMLNKLYTILKYRLE